MFRARRRFFRGRRRGSFTKRLTQINHSVNIAQRTLAAATTEDTILIQAADSPATTQVASFGTAANCENNSLVYCKKLRLNFVGSGTVVQTVAVILWRDSAFAGITTPTSAEDVIAPSTSTQLLALKRNTCWYRKFFLSVQSDKISFNLKIPRRLALLKEGETYHLTVTNLTAAGGALQYFCQGTLVSRKL